MTAHRLRLVVTSVVLATSCGEEGGGRPALSDWSAGYSSGYDPSGPIIEPVADAFGVYPVEDSNLPMRLHVTGSEQACALDALTGTPEGFAELDCTLDIEEFDLHAPGLFFRVEVPAGLCAYLVYWWYQYEVWQVDVGPETVSYTIDGGNIVDEVNSIGGQPSCPYDYRARDTDAPNCCLGSYVLEVTDAATGQINTRPPQPWGGKPSECYGGAAFVWPEARFTDDGWPLRYWEHLNYNAYARRFEWPDVSWPFATNVPLASYYDPADHEGDKPAGLAGAWAVEHYNLVCADRAYEVLGHIKLTVREWNEQAEFEDSGDPDTTGLEPSGGPIEDFADWATATPGASLYLEDRE